MGLGDRSRGEGGGLYGIDAIDNRVKRDGAFLRDSHEGKGATL